MGVARESWFHPKLAYSALPAPHHYLQSLGHDPHILTLASDLRTNGAAILLNLSRPSSGHYLGGRLYGHLKYVALMAVGKQRQNISKLTFKKITITKASKKAEVSLFKEFE